MRGGWRSRFARGAVLAVVAGLAFTAGYDLYARRLLMNPSDAALAARFRAHRAEFEDLLRVERAHLRPAGYRLATRDSARSLSRLARRDPRWRTLTRSLGLDGTSRLASDSLVYFASSAWFPRVRFDDVKGYAFAAAPPGNIVGDLDAAPAHPRRRGEVLRWHRPLGGDWYLFREVGGGAYR